MSPRFDNYARQVISGRCRGGFASLLRGGLALAEPLYATLMSARNRSYERGIRRSQRLHRPVISVGNITTGGTGKTPIVMWLAERLRGAGRHPGILLRGYRAGDSNFSDEAALLDRRLNRDASVPVRIKADPDRVRGAASLLQRHPDVDVFILDDAFQHRRVARDFDLVLIDATNPFGYGRVLPRGLLREPLTGLARADALLITRANEVSADALARLEQTLKRLNPHASTFKAAHVMPEQLRKRVFAFCGIGNPDSFIRGLGSSVAGSHTFPDHHRYSVGDLLALRAKAASVNADEMVTTEKDWVKVERLAAPPGGPPTRAVSMDIRFGGEDEIRLFDQIVRSITPPRS